MATNRIRELRDMLGWNAEELASRAGTTMKQIYRLESGERRLTLDWMNRLAAALGCAPGDLISGAIPSNQTNDVEPYSDPGGGGQVLSAIEAMGLRAYKVTGGSVAEVGPVKGDVITVNEDQDYVKRHLTDRSIVLVRMGEMLLLRQFVAPALLILNQPGTNLIVRTDDAIVQPKIVGLVLQNKPA